MGDEHAVRPFEGPLFHLQECLGELESDTLAAKVGIDAVRHGVEINGSVLSASVPQGMGKAIGIHTARQVQVIEKVNKDQVKSFGHSMHQDGGVPFDQPEVRVMEVVEMENCQLDHHRVYLHSGNRHGQAHFLTENVKGASSSKSQDEDAVGWRSVGDRAVQYPLPDKVKAAEGLVAMY